METSSGDEDSDHSLFMATYNGILEDDKLKLLWTRIVDFYPGKDGDYRIRKAGEFIQEMFESGDIHLIEDTEARCESAQQPEQLPTVAVTIEHASQQQEQQLQQQQHQQQQQLSELKAMEVCDSKIEREAVEPISFPYFVALFSDHMSESELKELWDSISTGMTGLDRRIEATMMVMDRLESRFSPESSEGSHSDSGDSQSDEADFVLVRSRDQGKAPTSSSPLVPELSLPPLPPPPAPLSSATLPLSSAKASSSLNHSAADDSAGDGFVLLDQRDLLDVDAMLRALEREDERIARRLAEEEEATAAAARMELGTHHEEHSLRLARKLQRQENQYGLSAKGRKSQRRKHRLHDLRGISVVDKEKQPLTERQQQTIDTVKLLLLETVPVSDQSVLRCLELYDFDVNSTASFIMKNHADTSYAGRLKGIDKAIEEQQKAVRAAAMEPAHDIVFTPLGKARKSYSCSCSEKENRAQVNSDRSSRLENYLKYCVLQTVRKNNPGIVFQLDGDGEFSFRGFPRSNDSKRGLMGHALIFPLELRYQLGSECIHASVDLHGLYVESAVHVVDLILDYYLHGEGVRAVAAVTADAATAVNTTAMRSAGNAVLPLHADPAAAAAAGAARAGSRKRSPGDGRGVFVLQLIVGKGLHSVGQRPRISPAVTALLQREWKIAGFKVDEGRVFVPLRV